MDGNVSISNFSEMKKNIQGFSFIWIRIIKIVHTHKRNRLIQWLLAVEHCHLDSGLFPQTHNL